MLKIVYTNALSYTYDSEWFTIFRENVKDLETSKMIQEVTSCQWPRICKQLQFINWQPETTKWP